MIRALWDACVLLWILAHEVDDPEDGEERTLPALRATSPCRGGMDEGREAVA